MGAARRRCERRCPSGTGRAPEEVTMRRAGHRPPGGTRRSRFFAALGRGVVRHPIRVVLIWLAVIGAGYAIGAGAFFETSSVRQTNPADALPTRYESSAAIALEQRGFPEGDDATATLVVSRRDGGQLSPADASAVEG